MYLLLSQMGHLHFWAKERWWEREGERDEKRRKDWKKKVENERRKVCQVCLQPHSNILSHFVRTLHHSIKKCLFQAIQPCLTANCAGRGAQTWPSVGDDMLYWEEKSRKSADAQPFVDKQTADWTTTAASTRLIGEMIQKVQTVTSSTAECDGKQKWVICVTLVGGRQTSWRIRVVLTRPCWGLWYADKGQ